MGLTSHQLHDGGKPTGSGVVVSDGAVDNPDLTDSCFDVHVGQENAGMPEEVKGGQLECTGTPVLLSDSSGSKFAARH